MGFIHFKCHLCGDYLHSAPTMSKNLSNTLGRLGVQQPPCVREVLHKPPFALVAA